MIIERTVHAANFLAAQSEAHRLARRLGGRLKGVQSTRRKGEYRAIIDAPDDTE